MTAHGRQERGWGAQDGELDRLYHDGVPIETIAALLRRPPHEVMERLARLGLMRARARTDPRRRPALRRCLGPCGKPFRSAGAHNRICPDCALIVSGAVGGYDEAATHLPRRGAGRR